MSNDGSAKFVYGYRMKKTKSENLAANRNQLKGGGATHGQGGGDAHRLTPQNLVPPSEAKFDPPNREIDPPWVFFCSPLP